MLSPARHFPIEWVRGRVIPFVPSDFSVGERDGVVLRPRALTLPVGRERTPRIVCDRVGGPIGLPLGFREDSRPRRAGGVRDRLRFAAVILPVGERGLGGLVPRGRGGYSLDFSLRAQGVAFEGPRGRPRGEAGRFHVRAISSNLLRSFALADSPSFSALSVASTQSLTAETFGFRPALIIARKMLPEFRIDLNMFSSSFSQGR